MQRIIDNCKQDPSWADKTLKALGVGGKAAKKVTTPKGERVVHKGPRGGEYVIYKGEKVSASRFAKKGKKANKKT